MLCALLAGPGCSEERRCLTVQPDPPCGGDAATVARIVDGDTVELENGDKVRYIGVDTPELSGSERYAWEAREYNRSLVEGAEVELEYDTDCRDYYLRLLAYVCIDGIMVQEELLRSGMAKAYPFPPNTRYREHFKELEQEAKSRGVGVWSP